MTAAVSIPPPMPFPQLDATVKRVSEHAREFARLSIDERIALLERLMHGFREVAQPFAEEACRFKGIDPRSPLAGEEWLAGPMVTVRLIRLTLEGLKDVKKYGAPKVEPKWVKDLPDGRISVRVYPTNAIDGALLAKHTGEVHMLPGVTRENLSAHQAGFYRKPHDGRTCLVLGAGNQNCIPPTDVISKMFIEGTVCVLKMNPVNGYIGPLLERAFAPLVARGFLGVVYGEVKESEFLCDHALVDEIHITGSDKTFDAIYWGTGADAVARRARNEPKLKKAISSELGNVSPVIVVPGPWDAKTLDFQARSVAGMVSHNASFNCVSAKMLVTSGGWEGRTRFIDGVGAHLASIPTRKAYYPGAEQRFHGIVDGRKSARLIGQPGPGELPYAIVPGLDAQNRDERLYRHEPWCTVLGETPLPAQDPVAFLDDAVRFCNEQLWGTLCAHILVHPKTLESPQANAAVEKAIRELRYGSVCINTWAGAVFGLGTLPWGGHPSSTPNDIQSGSGWVHNTYMFDAIEKSVVRAPAKTFPVSPWVPGHRSVDALGKSLLELEMKPSWLKLAPVVAAALRG